MYANVALEKIDSFWEHMIVKHQLGGNNWVFQTYEKRFMWATTYLRDNFFIGMMNTSLSKSVKSCLKRYIMRTSTIEGLLSKFEHILRDYMYNELSSDFKSF